MNLKKVEKKLVFNCKNNIIVETHEFTVPKSIGAKQKTASDSKGVGVDREIKSVEKKM